MLSDVFRVEYQIEARATSVYWLFRISSLHARRDASALLRKSVPRTTAD